METLSKRLWSLAWRVGGMMAVASIGFFIEPATLQALADAGVAIPAFAVVLLGLVMGEITKWLNSQPKG